jgi:MFS family permease
MAVHHVVGVRCNLFRPVRYNSLVTAFYFFIIGNVTALIGAIICAAAQSVNVVIVGMTFGGIGAAHQQLAIAGLSEIFPNKYRAYVQGT